MGKHSKSAKYNATYFMDSPKGETAAVFLPDKLSFMDAMLCHIHLNDLGKVS